MGLLGVDGGVLLSVAGIWTLRSLAGADLDIAWGIATAGAAMRWGTLGFGDVQVATRLVGPALLAGPIPVRAGLTVAFGAALVGEVSLDPLRDRSLAMQVAAVGALVALIPLFLIRGGTNLAAPRWLGAGAVLGAVALYGPRYAKRVPRWAPPVAAAGGVVLAMLSR